MPAVAPAQDLAVAEALRLLAAHVRPLAAERRPLAQARGRVLREDLLADADQPAFDRSAMDGYAFRPLAGPAQLRIVGALKAGDAAARAPGPGEAWRIFTGATLPAPGLAVLPQEEARVEGATLQVDRAVAAGEFVRVRAADARAGAPVLRAGAVLGPAELAIAAGVGATRPLVTRAPRVAHATTGDELVAPEAAPGAGQIRDTNQVLVAALLAEAGVPEQNIHAERWGDNAAAARARLAAEPFAAADLVLISGGASVGEHDYAADALAAAGFELLVQRVNSRPGRPLLAGVNGARLAFGLPGNPVSHFVCFHLFVRPVLARLAGAPPPAWTRARLAAPLLRAANRRPTYWPARLGLDAAGCALATPLAWSNSGHLSALAGVGALLAVPPATAELPAGAELDMLPTACLLTP